MGFVWNLVRFSARLRTLMVKELSPISRNYRTQPPELIITIMKRLISRYPHMARTTQQVYRRFQPRVTVGAVGVLFNDEHEVLLVEHVFHSIFKWGLPGGWVDGDELPDHAVEREFHEETGLEVTAVYPVMVWKNRHWRNHLNLSYMMRASTPIPETLTLSSELTDFQWAALDDLPPIMPDHRRVIKRAHSLMLTRGNKGGQS